MEEEDVEDQLAKQEMFRVKQTVQQAKQKGNFDRYNSLKQRERNEDERIEQMLELDEEGNVTEVPDSKKLNKAPNLVVQNSFVTKKVRVFNTLNYE